MSNQSGVTHCVMRRGASWFAFPAEKVREVLFRPPLLAVPHSDPLLAGLCHVRSEFFPVLRLDALLVDDPARRAR
jgi:chemotaxis signal transduction protein